MEIQKQTLDLEFDIGKFEGEFDEIATTFYITDEELHLANGTIIPANSYLCGFTIYREKGYHLVIALAAGEGKIIKFTTCDGEEAYETEVKEIHHYMQPLYPEPYPQPGPHGISFLFQIPYEFANNFLYGTKYKLYRRTKQLETIHGYSQENNRKFRTLLKDVLWILINEVKDTDVKEAAYNFYKTYEDKEKYE
jgi:hypothetical protein